jgi:hypothetical protein
LRGAALLIRPHPQNAQQWQDFDASAFEAVGIWPRAGANPVDRDARSDYYDSMYHSVAVVGVNTSALIESGIVGRPVYTVLTDEFSGSRNGTLHFQHLKNVNGGLLTVASSLEEHCRQLADAVRRRMGADPRSRAFIEAFVRPHGLGEPAADRFRGSGGAGSTKRPAPRSHATGSAHACCCRSLRRWRWQPALRSAAADRSVALKAKAVRRPLKLPVHRRISGVHPLFRFDDVAADRSRATTSASALNRLRERKHARSKGWRTRAFAFSA